MCKYPGCKNLASETWALVPLCEGHHQDISTETMRFYEKTIIRGQRYMYQQIEHLIPWSNLNMEMSDRKCGL